MADKTPEDKQLEKLKELEQSLAKELDKNVKLADLVVPRLDGSVAMNPDLKHTTSKPESSGNTIKGNTPLRTEKPTPNMSGAYIPKKTGAPEVVQMPGLKKVDEISLQDVDDILNEIDVDFNRSLDIVKREIGPLEHGDQLESIKIGKEYLKGDEDRDDDDDEDDEEHKRLVEDIIRESKIRERRQKLGKEKVTGLLRLLARAVGQLVIMPVRIFPELFKRFKQIGKVPFKALISEFAGVLPSVIKPFSDSLATVLARFKTYKLRQYLSFLGLLGGIALMVVIWNQIQREMILKNEPVEPFIRSFADVSSSVELIPNENEGEELDSPDKHPEYTVFMDRRIIATLKSPNPRRHPMVNMEMYLEVSSQDSAIEVRDRGVEVKDITLRILEEETFESLETLEGKNRLKLKIRNGVNKILNHGHVRRVFFKTFYIKA